MLVLVLSMLDFEQLVTVFKRISFSTLVIVVAGYSIGQVVSSYKWWLLARNGSLTAPWTTALRAYFIGMYANCFGLGVVGGDVLRGVVLAGKNGSKTQAMASVVADRVHGLTVLAIIGVIFAFSDGRNLISPNLKLITLLSAFAVIIFWFLGPKLALRLVPEGNRFYETLEQALKVFPKDPVRIGAVTILSAALHILQIWLHYVIITGLGLNVPFLFLLSSIPFVNILSSLPVSWNGLGVRENAYVFFLSPAFLTKEEAVAMGAVWLLAVTITSAVGGIVSALEGTKTDRSIEVGVERST